MPKANRWVNIMYLELEIPNCVDVCVCLTVVDMAIHLLVFY